MAILLQCKLWRKQYSLFCTNSLLQNSHLYSLRPVWMSRWINMVYFWLNARSQLGKLHCKKRKNNSMAICRLNACWRSIRRGQYIYDSNAIQYSLHKAWAQSIYRIQFTNKCKTCQSATHLAYLYLSSHWCSAKNYTVNSAIKYSLITRNLDIISTSGWMSLSNPTKRHHKIF